MSAGAAPPLPRARLDALEQRLAHLVSGLLGLGAGGPGQPQQQQQEGLVGAHGPTAQQQQQQQGLVGPDSGTTQPPQDMSGSPQRSGGILPPAVDTGIALHVAGEEHAAEQAAGEGVAQQPMERLASPTPDELVGLMRCWSSSSRGAHVEPHAPTDSTMPTAVSAQLAQQLFRSDSQQPAEVRAAAWYTLLLVWQAVVLLEQVHDTLHQLRRQLPGVVVPD